MFAARNSLLGGDNDEIFTQNVSRVARPAAVEWAAVGDRHRAQSAQHARGLRAIAGHESRTRATADALALADVDMVSRATRAETSPDMIELIMVIAACAAAVGVVIAFVWWF